MNYTKHIQKRMSQRGIKQEYLHAVSGLGRVHGDKLILTKKNCLRIAQELSGFIQFLSRVSKTGACFNIQENGAAMTAYCLNDLAEMKELAHYRIAA